MHTHTHAKTHVPVQEQVQPDAARPQTDVSVVELVSIGARQHVLCNKHCLSNKACWERETEKMWAEERRKMCRSADIPGRGKQLEK